jgi:hypothetical protein
MHHPFTLCAALVVLVGAMNASAQNHSACHAALQNLGSTASSASFEANRAESDCRDADSSCRSLQSCRIVPGVDVSGSCQAQQTACESASRRCDTAETSLDRSVGAVQSAMSTVQLSCR